MSRTSQQQRFIGRRSLMALGAVHMGLALPLGGLAKAAVGPLPRPFRRLRIESLHTGEAVDLVFQEHGRNQPQALAEIDWVMRDWRTDEQRTIDRDLLNLLSDLHALLEAQAPFHLISGYRSPKTNAMLAAKSGGVARKSLHLKGMAADIALPDRSLALLHKAAVDMKRGGVGLYRRTGFVHVDTGRVRYW